MSSFPSKLNLIHFAISGGVVHKDIAGAIASAPLFKKIQYIRVFHKYTKLTLLADLLSLSFSILSNEFSLFIKF